MSRNVLVTGGAGYIGSHTCLELARAGFSPVVFDNLQRGNDLAVQWGPLVVGDLNDKDRIRDAIERYRVTAVLHFAAFAYVGESVQDPSSYYRNNVANTLNLLDVMVETGVKHLVFSSTCAVYGVPQRLPITEETPVAPINPYGETKLQVERMLHWFGMAHDLKWVALRYFNAAGADPEGRIGESHEPETHLIPLAIQAALGLQPPLKIFGNDYATPDGTAIRDFIHVADLADAHKRALDYLRAGGASTIFNLGSGRGFSVKEIIEEIRRGLRLGVPHEEVARRPGDPPQLVANAERAHRILHWQPKLSDLATIVRTAADWERKRPLIEAA